jgi:hypothetical protein
VPRFIAGLEAIGAAPRRVPAYRTAPGLPGPDGPAACAAERALLQAGDVAAIVFSSTAEVRVRTSARVRAFLRARAPVRMRPRACCPLVPLPAAAQAREGPPRWHPPPHRCHATALATPPAPPPTRQAQGLCRLMGGRDELAAAITRAGVVLAAHGPYTAAGASEVLGLPVPVVSKR